MREGRGGETKEEQREASGGLENSIGALSLLWGPTETAVAFWVGNRVAGWRVRVAGRSWWRMGIGDLSPPLRSWNLRG